MARFGAQDIVAKTVEKVVNEWNRPDVAALLLLKVSLILIKMSSAMRVQFPFAGISCYTYWVLASVILGLTDSPVVQLCKSQLQAAAASLCCSSAVCQTQH